jgi:hypothetical protein
MRVNYFLFSLLITLVIYFDLISSPLHALYAAEGIWIGTLLKKAVQSPHFRRSKQVKWILFMMMLYFSVKVYLGISFVSHQYQQHQSLYSLGNRVEDSMCEECYASSDTGAFAGGLKHRLRNKDDFVLQTNPVLKMVGEAKENKTPDFKPAGEEWLGEKEKRLIWNATLEEAKRCGADNGGLCGSELPLYYEDSTIPGEELAEEEFAEAAPKESAGDQRGSIWTWKKVAVGAVILYSGYKIYQGEIPAAISNVLHKVKTTFARPKMSGPVIIPPQK